MSTTPISGITNPVPVNTGETTSPKMKELYEQYMQKIQEIMNKPEWTNQDYQDLLEAVDALAALAQNGIQDRGIQYYMPKEMLEKLDAVFSMLNAVGITPASGTRPPLSADDFQIGLMAMRTLKDIEFEQDGKKINFLTVLTAASQGLGSIDKSLYTMITVDLFTQVNETYKKSLEELNAKLEITKKLTDILKNLQDILNRVAVPSPENYKVPPESLSDIPQELVNEIRKKLSESDQNNPAKYIEWVNNNLSKYTDMSNDYFSRVQYPVPIDSLLQGSGRDLLSAREGLRQQLELLKQHGQSTTEEGSLANSIDKVLQILDERLAAYDAKYEKALIDYPDGDFPPELREDMDVELSRAAYTFTFDSRDGIGGQSGRNQNAISDAVTGNQNLSDELKEELSMKNLDYTEKMRMIMDMVEALKKIWDKAIQGTSH